MIACFIKNDKDLLLIRAHERETQRCAFKASCWPTLGRIAWLEWKGEYSLDESSQKASQNRSSPSLLASHLILMLHSITLPASEVPRNYGCHPGAVPFFPSLFRKWLACRRCSKYDFTSTYGNPLFPEHFHIQANICFL